MSNLKYKTSYQTELPLKVTANGYAKNTNHKQANNSHYGNNKNENGDKSGHKNEKYGGSENKKGMASQILSGNKESSYGGENGNFQSGYQPNNMSIQYSSSYRQNQNTNKGDSSSKLQDRNSSKKNPVHKQQSNHAHKQQSQPLISNKNPTNPPSSSSKILSQHNSSSSQPQSYSSSLFPQPQSIKQKLKQSVQQQMLNNYYINKYQSLMNKLSKEKIRIDQSQENQFMERGDENVVDDQRYNGQKSSYQRSEMGNGGGRRKNFKEVMRERQQRKEVNVVRQFGNESQGNYNKHENFNRNNSHSNSSNFNKHNNFDKHNQLHQFQTNNIKHQQPQKRDNEFLTITFSPSKRFNLHINHDSQPNPHQHQTSRSKISDKSNSQSVNKKVDKPEQDRSSSRYKKGDGIVRSINRKESNQNRSGSKNHSNNNSRSKINNYGQKQQYRSNTPLLKKPNNTVPPHPSNPPNFPSLPQHQQTNPFTFSLHHSPHKPHSSQQLHNHPPTQPHNPQPPNNIYHSSQPHKQHPSPPRHNFKQSLKQKKSLYVQYEQNLNLYKQLESSIINELYSPSPKKIEKLQYDQIHLFNRELSGEELGELQKDYYLAMGNSDRSQSQGTKRNNYHTYNHHHIQVNDDQLQLQQLQRQYTQRQSYQQASSQQKIKNLQKLKLNIKNSFHSSKSSLSNHPYRQYSSPENNQSSPSLKPPLQSPKRSLISDQYKSKHSQTSDQQDKWNPFFSNNNTHNKKLLIGQSSPIKKRIDMIAPLKKTSPQRKQRKYYSLEKTSPNLKKIIENIKQVGEKSQRKNNNSLHIQIKQEEQPESDFQASQQANYNSIRNHPYNYAQSKKHETKSQVNDKFYLNASIQAPKFHQRKGSFHSIKSSPKPQPESRYIHENNNSSKNSFKEDAKSPSAQQDDDDIQFVPPADEALFDSRSSHNHSQKSGFNSRKNHIETIGQTRSRKASDQLSFMSDSVSFNEMSMLSRFSMTSEEGSMIIHKLENEITQNQFGPYQNALQSLRDLLNQNKTAWPIYVVGQKILDDRAEYEKKIELQKSMLEDYKQKIIKLNQIREIQQKKEYSTILKNQLKILRLIRQLSSEA